MANESKKPMLSILERIVPRMKYPHLFVALLALFLIDLFVPDPLPLVDEALLAILTILVGSWRDRRGPEAPQAPKDVTDRGSDERV